MVVAAASWAHSATVSDLESARRSLSAARDAVSTASVELRTLLADGGLTKTGIEDYRSYLARLKQSVVSNCRTLLELKQDLGDSGPEPGCDPRRMAPAGPVSFPQERTEAEKTASLDGQLGASLSEFDELLLREMEDLKRKQSGSPDTAAGSGSGEGENQSESQGESSSTASGGAESGDSGLSGTGAQQQGAEQQGEEQQQGGEVAARSEQNSQQQGAGNAGSREGKDDSTGTGRRDQPPAADDDDIVARQLREAAENESDPELREKLWQEYRRYKANQTTQSKN
jgi:hypothetical protein